MFEDMSRRQIATIVGGIGLGVVLIVVAVIVIGHRSNNSAASPPTVTVTQLATGTSTQLPATPTQSATIGDDSSIDAATLTFSPGTPQPSTPPGTAPPAEGATYAQTFAIFFAAYPAGLTTDPTDAWVESFDAYCAPTVATYARAHLAQFFPKASVYGTLGAKVTAARVLRHTATTQVVRVTLTRQRFKAHDAYTPYTPESVAYDVTVSLPRPVKVVGVSRAA